MLLVASGRRRLCSHKGTGRFNHQDIWTATDNCCLHSIVYDIEVSPGNRLRPSLARRLRAPSIGCIHEHSEIRCPSCLCKEAASASTWLVGAEYQSGQTKMVHTGMWSNVSWFPHSMGGAGVPNRSCHSIALPTRNHRWRSVFSPRHRRGLPQLGLDDNPSLIALFATNKAWSATQ